MARYEPIPEWNDDYIPDDDDDNDNADQTGAFFSILFFYAGA